MPLLTQGKTNWKFLLIVVVLAAVVGGGIWFLSNLIPEEIKVTEKPPKERITNIFEVNLPVNVLRTTFFSEEDPSDRSIGVLLKDYNGKEFAFCLDKRSLFNHYFFFGAEHPSKETAQKILYGSEEEKQLLKILESWDHSDWQPANQFDNSKAVILMFIRELNYEFNTNRKEQFSQMEIRIGEMNRVYQNEEFGFEFRFPENWFIIEGPYNEYTEDTVVELWIPERFAQRAMDLAGGSPQKNISVEIGEIKDYGVSSLDEFIELITNESSYISIAEEGRMQISGRDAYLVHDRGGHTFYYYSAIFEKDNYLYQIDFQDSREKKLMDTEREILSTFRFIEDETADWQTYRNENQGFEVYFPPLGDWKYFVSADSKDDKIDRYFSSSFNVSEDENEISFVIQINMFGEDIALPHWTPFHPVCVEETDTVFVDNKINKEIHSAYQTSEVWEGPLENCNQIIDSSIKNQHSVGIRVCLNDEYEAYYPTVGGYRELEYICDQEGNDSLYNIYLLCEGKHWEGSEGADKCDQLFEQIISTFKFLK